MGMVYHTDALFWAMSGSRMMQLGRAMGHGRAFDGAICQGIGISRKRGKLSPDELELGSDHKLRPRRWDVLCK